MKRNFGYLLIFASVFFSILAFFTFFVNDNAAVIFNIFSFEEIGIKSNSAIVLSYFLYFTFMFIIFVFGLKLSKLLKVMR